MDNSFSTNAVWDENGRSTLPHHAPLPKPNISCINMDAKLRFVLANIIENNDPKERLLLLAQLDVNGQLAVLSAFAKIKYQHGLLRRYKFLTPQEKAIIQQLIIMKVPLARIARILGRQVSTIYYYVKRLKYGREEVYI